MKFTGKTSDRRKCSRSAITEAYVDKRVAGKKGSTNKYQYHPTSAGEKSNAPWDGLVDLWRCRCIHCLHLVWLASCKTFKLLSFNAQWFRDLGVSFSSFGCFLLWSSFSKLPFLNDINYLGSCTSSASGKRTRTWISWVNITFISKLFAVFITIRLAFEVTLRTKALILLQHRTVKFPTPVNDLFRPIPIIFPLYFLEETTDWSLLLLYLNSTSL